MNWKIVQSAWADDIVPITVGNPDPASGVLCTFAPFLTEHLLFMHRNCLLWPLHSGTALLPRWSKVSSPHRYLWDWSRNWACSSKCQIERSFFWVQYWWICILMPAAVMVSVPATIIFLLPLQVCNLHSTLPTHQRSHSALLPGCHQVGCGHSQSQNSC